MTTPSTILVVEDSDSERAQLAEMLRSHDYRVREAPNGAAAIQQIAMHPDVRVALVDWNMPLVSGIEVCRYARSRERFIHVVMLTGRTTSVDLSCALENGANDYIRKPFEPEEVLARIRAAQRMCETQDALMEAQRLETLGQLAAGVAHEINSPIQFVGDNVRFFEEVWQDLVGLLESSRAVCRSVAERGSPDPERVAALAREMKQADLEYLATEVPRALGQAKEGVERISKIVRAMKDFGHARSIEKLAANLNDSIESSVVLSRNEWKYVAEVDLDLCPDLPQVECDVSAVNQVVLNLVVNAAHAIAEDRSSRAEPHTAGADAESDTSSKGRIAIRTRSVGDEVEIVIEDDGPGIPEAIQARIFERFFTTKPVGKGTGQGLAIAREIIEGRHGGRIACENREGGGARFSVWLPVSARSDPQAPAATEPGQDSAE